MPKILVIDDKKDNLIAISALLKNLVSDCTTITAQSGAEGIKKAQTEMPDTILLDIKMPEMDGFEVCRALKKDENTERIPIIILTAIKTDSKSRVKALETGADAFLTKPIEEPELVAQVNTALRIKNAEDVLRNEKDLLEVLVKERTKALQESESRYRTFFEKGPDGVVILDPETARPIEFNYQVCRQLGYSKEEFALLRMSDIEAKETAKETQVHIRKIQREGYGNFETLQRTKQGEIRHVHVTAQMIELAGNPVCHCIWRDSTERKQAEEKVKASLKEKEVLLSEIHHRVKNNMQVITSLLRLQADKLVDKKYADMFKESEDRIRSMALIHEQLYQSKDFANIHFGEYIKSLAKGLFTSHGVDTNQIKLKIDIKDVSFDLENAIPCGLIINELVSNSLKHAFPGERTGEIEISLHTINEVELELKVSDDGVGIPEDLDIRDAESMGLHIVRILAEQTLEGKMDSDKTEGTHFHFQLKRSKYKPRI